MMDFALADHIQFKDYSGWGTENSVEYQGSNHLWKAEVLSAMNYLSAQPLTPLVLSAQTWFLRFSVGYNNSPFRHSF